MMRVTIVLFKKKKTPKGHVGFTAIKGLLVVSVGVSDLKFGLNVASGCLTWQGGWLHMLGLLG